LVLANANYSKGQMPQEALEGPRAIADQLKKLGFVVVQLDDASRKSMRSAMKRFAEGVEPGEVSLVYFFGHAVQKGGANYLLPIDFPPSPAKTDSKAVELGGFLESLQARQVSASIFIADACYPNALGGDAKGLAPVAVPPGMLAAFSATPGSVVDIAAGETLSYGRYTRHLLSQLKEPQSQMEEVFRRVRRQVAKETDNKHVPWEGSALTVDFVIGAEEAVRQEL
jgi:uncharacterized caspase-like protein